MLAMSRTEVDVIHAQIEVNERDEAKYGYECKPDHDGAPE
jgi:hypothetical protein